MPLDIFAPFYKRPDGELVQAEATEDGYVIPYFEEDGDGPVTPPRATDEEVSAWVIKTYGYDPTMSGAGFRYAGGGERTEMFNYRKGIWELGVDTAEGRMPLSVAIDRGLPFRQLPGHQSDKGFLSQIVEFGGEVAQIAATFYAAYTGASLVDSAIGAVTASESVIPSAVGNSGLVGGAESSWVSTEAISTGLSGPGALEANAALGLGSGSVLGDVADAVLTVADTPLVGGAEGDATLAGGAEGAQGGGIATGFSGPGAAAANAALGLGSGSVLGDIAAGSIVDDALDWIVDTGKAVAGAIVPAAVDALSKPAPKVRSLVSSEVIGADEGFFSSLTTGQKIALGLGAFATTGLLVYTARHQ